MSSGARSVISGV